MSPIPAPFLLLKGTHIPKKKTPELGPFMMPKIVKTDWVNPPNLEDKNARHIITMPKSAPVSRENDRMFIE